MKHVWTIEDLRNGLTIARYPWNEHTPAYLLVVGRNRNIAQDEFDAHKKYVRQMQYGRTIRPRPPSGRPFFRHYLHAIKGWRNPRFLGMVVEGMFEDRRA
ncbi:hypothetical protein ACVIWU_006618 [Bradyrhizobium sp. USDA 4509]